MLNIWKQRVVSNTPASQYGGILHTFTFAFLTTIYSRESRSCLSVCLLLASFCRNVPTEFLQKKLCFSEVVESSQTKTMTKLPLECPYFYQRHSIYEDWVQKHNQNWMGIPSSVWNKIFLVWIWSQVYIRLQRSSMDTKCEWMEEGKLRSGGNSLELFYIHSTGFTTHLPEMP